VETLAWVESPLQAIGAVEAFSAGALGSAVTVHGRRGLEPVRRTIEQVERIAQVPGLTFERESSGLPRWSPRRPATIAVGDAMSGVSQRFLLRAGMREVVLLDDGRATRVVLRQLVDDAPLLRPQSQHGYARMALARMVSTRLRRIARHGLLTVFTAVDLDPALADAAHAAGIGIRQHSFDWLRAQPRPAPPATRVVVLGSALVANDLVAPGHYLDWVSQIVRVSDGVTYYAHRREDARTLAALRQQVGVTVCSGDVPVELTLRGLTHENVVHTLPSTAAHTLRLLCPGTAIREHPVLGAWWRPDAGEDVRRHLSGGREAIGCSSGRPS
jgi:hypothetical protein